MIGKLLSTALDVVTLPIDVANIGMDVLCGGDGSKSSRNSDDFTPTAILEGVRDRVSETLDDLDE